MSTIYLVKFCLTEPMLASSPADPKVYQQFIESRQRKDAEERGDEVATLPAEQKEKIGWSVFHRDKTGLFIFDYHVRGFLKSSAEAITGKALTAYKSKIDKWVWVSPRRIYLHGHDGTGVLQAPDGIRDYGSSENENDSLERPIRAMTMQGPRTSVKRSEAVDIGTKFQCELEVLPLGQKEFTKELLISWFDYGRYQGFGEWRTGSYGRFTYELSEVKGTSL